MASKGESVDANAVMIGLAVLILAAIGFLALRARGAGAETEALSRALDGMAQQQAALTGRLAQLAETQAAAQNQLSERLQAQERALAKSVEERLAALGKRMDDGLQASSQRQASTMHDLRERLAVIDAAQKNITELSAQVVGLQDILSNKQARGAFGEGRLQALVSDGLPRDSFAFQHTLENGRRADCAIFLPGDHRPLLVDSKFPLEAVTAFRESASAEARKQAEARLKQDVGKHIGDIAERYLVAGRTQDVALMFVPSESVYAELHEHFDDVIQRAFRARVILVSPSLLMLAIQVVQAIVKDARMREQADLIRAECGALVADVVRLRERVGNLQKHFAQVGDDVAQALISADKIARRGARIDALEFDGTPPAGPAESEAAPRFPFGLERGAAE